MRLNAFDFSISPGLSRTLNILRAASAFFVVIGHIRMVLYGGGENVPLLAAAFTGLGRYAVMVFFVLSGFLISREAIAAWALHTKTPLTYSIDRITRIYVVLIPALAMTAALDYVSGAGADTTSLPILLGNIFALQYIYVPMFGSNGPLWSLANELWYYALFPVGLYAALEKNAVRRMIAIAFLVLAAVALGVAITKLSIMWLAGAAAWLPRRGFLDRRLLWLALAAWIIYCGFHPVFPRGVGYLTECALAGITAALLNEYRHLRITHVKGRIASFFADFSFSVYLFHFPLVMAVAVIIKGSNHLWLWSAALIPLVYVYSYAMYLLFERHYHSIRRSIFTKFAMPW